MKVILSRKGFDSSTGGFASPIMPSGRLLSLPIPVKKEGEKGIAYEDLSFDGQPVSEIIQQLSNGRFNCKQQAHLDPDLDEDRYERVKGWRPVFGQTGSAQSHLKNNEVGKGDLFLFFGWFRHTQCKDNKLCYIKPSQGGKDLHVIFGWLQVGESYEVEKNKNHKEWLKYHPHIVNAGIKPYNKNNTIYISTDKLSFSGLSDKDGGGVFTHFKPSLQLTAPEEKARSHWCLPEWLCENFIEGKWSCRECHLPFDSGGRRQEFVFDVPDQNRQKAIDWLKEMF